MVDSEWQLQNDLATLMRATELRKNKKRMKQIMAYAKKQRDGMDAAMKPAAR